ncbi:MAG TPA: alkaline phosphatase family protein [Thermoanaerobaculia bacterium]
MRQAPRFVCAAALAATLAGCSVRSRVQSAAEAAGAKDRASVCVLFVDGLSKEAFDHLLAEGALPNIRREIVDRALVVDNAVASVPSETYPNLGAMLTGLFPGHHGIPANVWLDRRLRVREAHTNIFRTYAAGDFLTPAARTLFERLPADTVAVTTPIARGAAVHVKNTVAVMASYARYDWPFLDRKTLDDMGDAYAGAAASGRLPSLVWGHLLGPDEVAHAEGPGSGEFHATLVSIDKAFGRFVRRLRKLKVDDRILFVLVGDHGNRTYHTFVDANELVNRVLRANPTEADCTKGDCVLVSAPRKDKTYDVGDAMIAVGAYRGAMIWLPSERPPDEVPGAFRTRKQKNRKGTPAPRLRMPPVSAFAASLARAPEVRLVVTRGPSAGRVVVYGPSGRSEIARVDGDDAPPRYSYHVLEGVDPLGYAADPAVRGLLGAPRDADDWLDATAAGPYPDLVVQLPEFFDSPRAPDVFVSTAEGYGFTSGKAAGHGSLGRSETVVPFLFAGPGVPPGHRRAARTVDLAPTLLSYLGVAYDPEEMDGDDLEIAPAGAPTMNPLAPSPE